MAKMTCATEGASWDALRASLAHLTKIAEGPEASLLELGKGFASLAQAMLLVTEAAGQTSSRFRAVAKALELKTPKSALDAFLNA